MDLLRRLFHREEAAASFCSAVIVAGGRASRMEGIDKVLCPMGGEPLLLYTLMPFQTSSLVDEIVLVTREDLMVPIGTLCSQRGITKVRRVVKGGESRTDDCSAVERIGFPVCLIQGSEENIKITTPRDLTWGEAILAERMGR